MGRAGWPVFPPPMRLLILVLATALAGCASTRSFPGHADGPLAGTWRMTVRPVVPLGTGDLRTVLTFEPDGPSGFEAHSRPGAVRDLVGPLQARLAPLMDGEAFARGALVHIYDGTLAPAGDSTVVTGRLVSKKFKTLALTGVLAGGLLRGTLRSDNLGIVVAQFDAEPVTGGLPVQDYAALVPEAQAVLAAHYYDPRELTTPRWARFWADAGPRLGRAQDDLEALFQFSTATDALSLSHFGLTRTSEVAVPDDPSTSGVSFARRPDGTAVLTCLDFETAQATPVIEQAFAAMAADPPPALVVDLRACSGGDFSSMQVAAHLLEAPAAAGLFVSNAWWAGHDAAPPRATWDTLTPLTDLGLDAFFRGLDAHGALVARVEPAAPTYRGPVFVLTSGDTASAAEPLAYVLKQTGRATLVGAPTAGAMLAARPFPLSGGWQLLVPVADYVTAEGTRLEGVGVAPTVAVAPAEAMERALAVRP